MAPVLRRSPRQSAATTASLLERVAAAISTPASVVITTKGSENEAQGAAARLPRSTRLVTLWPQPDTT